MLTRVGIQRGVIFRRWTPAKLFAGSDGVWFDPSVVGTLLQASGGSAVGANWDDVGSMTTLAGTSGAATQATALKKPTYRPAIPSVRFADSQSLAWPADTLGNILNGKAGATFVFVLDNVSISGANQFENVLLDSRISSVGAAVYINLRGDGGNVLKVSAGGRSRSADSFQSAASSTAVGTGHGPTVLVVLFDYAASTIKIRINGVQVASASVTFGSATYAHTASATVPRLMQSADADTPAGSRDLRAFLLLNRVVTAGELAQVEAYYTARASAVASEITATLLVGGRLEPIVDAGSSVVVVGSRDPTPGRMFRSADGGQTWTALGNITGTSSSNGINCINKAPNGDLFATTGASVVWKSTDHGLTWSSLGTVASGTAESGFDLTFSIIATPAGTLLLADTVATGGSVWRSTNSGASWTKVATLGSRGLYRFSLTADGIIVNSWGGHIFKSTDDGANWSDKGQLENTSPLYAIETIPASNVALVATDEGRIYRSTDNGDTWSLAKTFAPGDGSDDMCAISGNNVVLSTYTGKQYCWLSRDLGVTWKNIGPAGVAVGDWGDHMVSIGGRLFETLSKGEVWLAPA